MGIVPDSIYPRLVMGILLYWVPKTVSVHVYREPLEKQKGDKEYIRFSLGKCNAATVSTSLSFEEVHILYAAE